MLHVAVRDRKGGYVGGLGQDAFRVSENKQPQDISFFNSQDAPVTVGLLIDGSGSMAPNRDMVIAASMAFSKAMNPEDEFFVLGFNEHLHAASAARQAVHASRADAARGTRSGHQSAGPDGNLQRRRRRASATCSKGGFERQVLVVVSDGGDNASAVTRAQVLANAQGSNAVIYTIALVDPMDSDADPGFLKELSEMTGGVAFRPKNVGEVGEIFQRVARDIRNMYTLGYVPSDPGRETPEASAKRRASPGRSRSSVADRAEARGAHEARISRRR